MRRKRRKTQPGQIADEWAEAQMFGQMAAFALFIVFVTYMSFTSGC